MRLLEMGTHTPRRNTDPSSKTVPITHTTMGKPVQATHRMVVAVMALMAAVVLVVIGLRVSDEPATPPTLTPDLPAQTAAVPPQPDPTAAPNQPRANAPISIRKEVAVGSGDEGWMSGQTQRHVAGSSHRPELHHDPIFPLTQLDPSSGTSTPGTATNNCGGSPSCTATATGTGGASH